MPYRDGRWRRVHGPHHRIEHKSHSHTCGCGKLAYRSKTEAKRAMREAQIRYAGESGHWGTYSCLTTHRPNGTVSSITFNGTYFIPAPDDHDFRLPHRFPRPGEDPTRVFCAPDCPAAQAPLIDRLIGINVPPPNPLLASYVDDHEDGEALMKHPDKTPATLARETTAAGLVFAEFWYATQARGDHHVVRLVDEVTEPRDGKASRGN
jgi:hypothetical protein